MIRYQLRLRRFQSGMRTIAKNHGVQSLAYPDTTPRHEKYNLSRKQQ